MLRFGSAVALGGLHSAPAGAETAAATCQQEAYGRRFALNVTADFTPTAPKPDRWQIRGYTAEFLSSNPDDTLIATKNNYVAVLHDAGNPVHTYVSPDDIRYGVTDVAVITPPTVSNKGSYTDFTGWFDTRDEPDVSCEAKVSYTGPGGVCLTCPIETDG